MAHFNENTPLQPTLKPLLRLALPNMGAMLSAALATIAETYYVGQLGLAALAGMALVFPMMMLQQMMSAGAMGGGVSSAISRAIGAGQFDRANSLAVHALWIAVTIGALFTLLMQLLAETIFAALGGSGAALQEALAYARWGFLGILFVWILNTLASVLRGTGNMAVPSKTLFLVAFLQIILGYALGLGLNLGIVAIPRMGMGGIAAGGLLASACGAAILLIYIALGRTKITLKIRQTKVLAERLYDILSVGAVACLSPLITVATIAILTRLVARFGDDALAGYGIGTRLEFLLVPIAFAIGIASVPMVGMAIGSGHVSQARKVAWTAAGVATLLLTTIGLTLSFFPNLWSKMFSSDAAVLAAAQLYFHWAGPAYGLFGLGLSLYFSSLGAGKVKGAIIAGALRLVVVALGGTFLAKAQMPTWTIFALVAFGMTVYGLSSVLFVRYTSWGTTPLIKIEQK